MDTEQLIALAVSCGAAQAAVVPVSALTFAPSFLDLCQSNACGNYGKCWMCPPHLGDIDALIKTAQQHDFALVYQTIGLLEDSYDFDGMMLAGAAHSAVSNQITDAFAALSFKLHLHLGAGGCHICAVCAKRTNQPCRHPDKAIPGLEAYGIAVSALAQAAGLSYNNGPDTVTYFGAFLYSECRPIRVEWNGHALQAQPHTLLCDIAPFSQHTAFICGKKGTCGKCKVIARGALSPYTAEEMRHLTPAERANGVRLACRCYAEGDCAVQSTAAREAAILAAFTMPAFSHAPLFTQYGVAIDIGTTTIAAQLYAHDTLLAQYTGLNPQASLGQDVMSRIEAALNGKAAALQSVLQDALCACILQLCTAAGIHAGNIDALVITGNTTMLYLLTGRCPQSLAGAPFTADYLFGEVCSAASLHLPCAGATVYLPPCISAFVGADITTALLASGIYARADAAMLVDIGTNGEIVFCKGGRIVCCATAAGPAFEGAGLSMGMCGLHGAIDHVDAKGNALCAHVLGEGAAVGICGSGIIDAVACLVQRGDIDESGFMQNAPITIQAPVQITQADVRQIQLAKSAVRAGMETLLHTLRVPAAQVDALYIAGGFGAYVSVQSAGAIGLIPACLCDKAIVLGNAALCGAAMLLLQKSYWQEAKAIAQKAETTELSTHPFFAQAFTEGMLFTQDITI